MNIQGNRKFNKYGQCEIGLSFVNTTKGIGCSEDCRLRISTNENSFEWWESGAFVVK